MIKNQVIRSTYLVLVAKHNDDYLILSKLYEYCYYFVRLFHIKKKMMHAIYEIESALLKHCKMYKH